MRRLGNLVPSKDCPFGAFRHVPYSKCENNNFNKVRKEKMDEFQIWQIWSSNRIGGALVGISCLLSIWLAMRIATATRNSEETNLFGQIVSSAFGLIVLAVTWMQYTFIGNNWVAASRLLSDLKASGSEISSTAEGYIASVGTEAVNQPMPLGIAFIVVSGLIILSLIWMPKK